MNNLFEEPSKREKWVIKAIYWFAIFFIVIAVTAFIYASTTKAHATTYTYNHEISNAEYWTKQHSSPFGTLNHPIRQRHAPALQYNQQKAIQLISSEAHRQGVPQKLALAIAHLESRFR